MRGSVNIDVNNLDMQHPKTMQNTQIRHVPIGLSTTLPCLHVRMMMVIEPSLTIYITFASNICLSYVMITTDFVCAHSIT